jgi:putative tricarboxylic transport membrane protein
MADRVFAGLALLATLAYGAIAFAVIRAPFQYDPLGPESWPRILSVVAALCCLFILLRPDGTRFDLALAMLARLAGAVALLALYAALFQPLGFILSTALFSAVAARALGSGWIGAAVFGAASGVLGYGLCAGLLELNLPAGLLG